MLSSIKKFKDYILFNEIDYLIRLAKTKILQASDTPELPSFIDPMQSESRYQILTDSAENLMRSILKTTSRFFLLALGFILLSTFASLCTPYLVNQFVTLIGQDLLNINQLIFIAFALGGLGMLSGVFTQLSFLNSLRAFQTVSNLLNIKLFKKSLKLTQSARAKYQVGDIVNLMGSDTETISDFTIVITELISSALIILGSLGLMFYYFGPSAWGALIMMLLIYPMTQKVSHLFDKYGDQLMSLKDQRMTILSQVIQSIRVVKYFAWEKAVKEEVTKVRDKEIATQKKIARAEVLSSMAYMALSTIVLFSLFLVHNLRGLELSMALIFTGVAVFAILEEPLMHISRLISRLISIHVSAKRITEFLKSETVDENKASVTHSDYKSNLYTNNNLLEVNQLNCKLGLQDVLKNISFKIIEGSSVAIVGAIGSGKSTLLNCLLGEYNHQGQILWAKPDFKLAYVTQDSYIVNATLEENILFGHDYDQKKLADAIYYAALESDISTFSGGLKTEIGEKGVNLSGGQKQRVALARAYYSQPEIIFLDDPLSAVDVETERILVERLFKQAWKSKTIIMATHRLQSLSSFHSVMFLKQGEMLAFGPLHKIKETSKELQDFFSYVSTHSEVELINEKIKPNQNQGVNLRITDDEERAQGAVESQAYLQYLKALGGKTYIKLGVATLMLGAILHNALPLLQKWWLTIQYQQFNLTSLQFIAVFGFLGFITLSVGAMNEFFWLYRGLIAGQIFHERLLNAILSSKIRFFDATPVGRILQRFSRDVESVDRHLQWSFNSAVHTGIYFLVSLALIISVVPFVILFLIPILGVYYLMQLKYRRAAREMKRLDSIARSPRYAHFKETLLGLPVIRAYKNQDWFLKEFFAKLSFSQRMYFSHYMLNRWFSVRIPLLGSALSICTLMVLIVAAKNGALSAGLAGLVTVYALNLWKSLNWLVRIFSDIESRMNSIERLKYYSEIPSETYDLTWSPEKNTNLVAKGLSVEFKNVQARYDQNLPLILKDITFFAKAGAKIGLIGRTGSGKSTVLQCLYRLVEIEAGDILIGGQSIKEIPLQKLRRLMAMVPQDPALFLGTIRSNIDRYNEYSDEEIFMALKRVQLDQFVHGLKNQLNEVVVENGNNFSQGQKQLFCLARALLIKAQVVVMDEATASVDLQTDAVIQKVLKEDLHGITRITIAHRLETIADSDLIVKIDNGVSKITLTHGNKGLVDIVAGPQ